METNMQKYQAFVTTVAEGSFTDAAEKLGYTQSAVSRMVGDLEKDWNVTLLERYHGGVTITADGTRMLPFAQRLVAEFENLQQQAHNLQGLETGTIRIGTFSSVATHWLPNIITRFQEDYPGITYELLMGDYEEIENWVKEGRIDCAFLPAPVSETLEFLPLEQDPLLAVLPEHHPLAEKEDLHLSDLCEDPFLILEKGSKAEIPSLFKEAGLTPNIHFTTWDDYTIMSMVESGLGISVLPGLILKRIPYHLVLRELNPPAYRQIGFVIKDRSTASLAVLKFMDYLSYRVK